MKSLKNYLALLCTTFAIAGSKNFLSGEQHSHHHSDHKSVLPHAETEILSVAQFNDGIRYGAPYDFTLRGMIYKGGSRNHHDLDRMSDDDKRNILIVELSHGSSDKDIPYIQGMPNELLIGYFATLVLLKECKIRSPHDLTHISLVDQVNTLIVETHNRLSIPVHELQRKQPTEIVKIALKWRDEFFAIENIYDLRFNLAAANADKTPHLVK
jgi:hypothetical protein